MYYVTAKSSTPLSDTYCILVYHQTKQNCRDEKKNYNELLLAAILKRVHFDSSMYWYRMEAQYSFSIIQSYRYL